MFPFPQQIESLKEKVHILSGQLGRQSEIGDQVNNQIRHLEDEKALLEARIAKMEDDFQNSEVARESLRRDKTTFMTFLERLGRALNADEIAKDVGVDLHTESLLLRAEQLARLETDKIVDKVCLFSLFTFFFLILLNAVDFCLRVCLFLVFLSFYM